MLPADVWHIHFLTSTHTHTAVGLHIRKNRAYTFLHDIYVKTIIKWCYKIKISLINNITLRIRVYYTKTVNTYV